MVPVVKVIYTWSYYKELRILQVVSFICAWITFLVPALICAPNLYVLQLSVNNPYALLADAVPSLVFAVLTTVLSAWLGRHAGRVRQYLEEGAHYE